MKLFKKIYYPLVAVLVIAITVFGIITANSMKAEDVLTAASAKKVKDYVTAIAEKTNDYDRGEYVRTTLRSDSGADIQDSEYNYYTGDDVRANTSNATFKLDASGKPVPTIVRHRATLNPVKADDGYYVNYELINYVVIFPGTDTVNKYLQPDDVELSYGDAVLFTANYDSDSVGKVGNAVAVANLMVEIERIASEKIEYKNDLLFLFTAGGENGKMGATAFKEQFKGYNDVYSRVKAVVAFDTVGSNGAVLLGEVSGDGSAMASAYAKANGKAYASSLTAELFSDVSSVGDFDVFSELNAMEITSIDNNTAGTIHDSVANVNENLISGLASLSRGAVRYFGNLKLDGLDGKLSAGYFNYLGGTVSYSVVLPYVLAGLLVLMLSAIVFLAIKKKAFCFIRLAKGAAVQALAALATLICAFVAYLLIGFIACGFEVINVHSLFTVVKSSMGLIVFALVAMLAISVFFNALFKKIFAVDSADVARGSAFLVAIVAIVTSFAFPQAAHLTVFAALIMLAILLVEVLCRATIMEKTGLDMQKLYLYAISAVLMLPVIFAEAFVVTSVAPLLMLPVILSIAVMLFGGVTPYVGDLAAVIEALATRAFGKVVIEEKEINGETKKVKRRQKVGYTNAFGASVIAVLCVIAVSLFALLGNVGFGTGSVTAYSYRDGIYKDAMVYVVDGESSSVEITDTAVYKYVAPYVDGFKWNADKNAYVLENAPTLIAGELSVNYDTNNPKKIIVTSKEAASYDYKVVLSGFGVGNITKVTFTTASNNETYKKIYDVSASTDDELVFIVPMDYGSDENGSVFNFEIEGAATSVDVTVERRSNDIQNKQNNALWQNVSYAYSNDAVIYENLKLNLITLTRATFELA